VRSARNAEPMISVLDGSDKSLGEDTAKKTRKGEKGSGKSVKDKKSEIIHLGDTCVKKGKDGRLASKASALILGGTKEKQQRKKKQNWEGRLRGKKKKRHREKMGSNR